jgi:L-ascorbate metabolism protein UlaG (beta-lactamase superfamily)
MVMVERWARRQTTLGDAEDTRMKITHLGHACLLVETGNARILIDPGAFSEGFAALQHINAVLVTHKHFDHFEPAAVTALMDASPEATLIVERSTADEVPQSVDTARTQIVFSGDKFDVKDVEIMAVGGTHARIHPDVDRIPNIGFYFTDSGLLHPGDEFTPPAVDVELLALPVSGPWQSLADAVDYLRAVNPAAAFPMHEALLSRPAIYYSYLNALKPKSTKFQVLEPGTPTEL